MYGSTDITSMRTTTWPSAGSGCSRSTSRKSWGVGSPCGRAASSHSRVVTVMARSCIAEVGPLRAGSVARVRGCATGLGSEHAVLPVQDAGDLGRGRAARSPRRAAARPRGPCRQRQPHPAALPRRHADRRLRRRVLLGRGEGLLGDPRRLLHGGGLRGRVHAEPHVRGGLFGAHRAHRGRAGRLRPGGHLLRAAAEGLLGGARPDPGHAPGQRHRHAVPLGDLLPEPGAGGGGAGQPRPVPGAAEGGGLRRHHHRDRAAGPVLLRRGLPPAVPLQGAQRLLPRALHRRLLPRRSPGRLSLTAEVTTLAADLFDGLRRAPDVEAPELVAVDATNRLLLDDAAEMLAACGPGEIAVVDDAYGALTLGSVALHGARDVRVAQDLLVGERALARNAERAGLSGTSRSLPLGPELASGARAVLVQAPKALEALREIAEVLAASAAPDVTVLVGGRVKHMTHAMNDVLRDSFTDVWASLARQKSRVLVARGPKPARSSFPRRQEHPDLGLTVCAHGAAFAGTKIDIGTRTLLGALTAPAPAATALDLGCGTGVLAASLARSRPDVGVVAVDQSAAAVASAAATAEANGLGDRIRVVRDDAADSVPAASIDLVVCNPPFHVGAAVVTTAADRLFVAAGRVLRPGGELWTVYNSALRYKPTLSRLVGPTRVAQQTPKFTVTVSTRR